jgi:hypothetical protein
VRRISPLGGSALRANYTRFDDDWTEGMIP